MDPITSGVLTNIDKARAWMETFTGPPEDLADAVDQASGWVEFFKHCQTGLQAQNTAAELKIRLQRKLGELLPESPGRGRPRKNGHDATLPDGIDRRQAMTYRRIAAVPAVEFENYLLTTKHADLELTTAGVLKLWRALNPRPKKGEEVTKEVQPDDDEPVRLEFWKSANTCRDEVKRISRKLKDVKLVLSGLVESPYKPLLTKAAHKDPLVTLAWDGDHADGASNGAVSLVSKVYTCPAIESLTSLVAGLELLFDREVGND